MNGRPPQRFHPKPLSTLGPLVETLAQYGDNMALLVLKKAGEEPWSYRTLATQAQCLAQGLVAAGVVKGDTIALLADNQPAWIIACLAIIQAGAVVVPLDTQLSAAVLSPILEDSGPRLLFASAAQAERLERLERSVTPRLVLLDADQDDRHWQRLSTATRQAMPSVAPDDPVALFYTSGTTGPPKGVPLSHGNLAFPLNTLARAEWMTPQERVLLPLPLHHVYPFVVGLLTPLFLGLPLIFPSALTGPQLIRALRVSQASLIIGVPRLYSALYTGIQTRVEAGGRSAVALFRAALNLSGWLRRWVGLPVGHWLLRPLHNRMGPTLRVLASGGASLDPTLAQQLEALGWQLAIGYGLTETAPLLTLNPPGKGRLDSVGRPLPGVDIRSAPLTPEEADHPQTTPLVGEIQAKGPNVFSGYRHLPEKTRDAFSEDGWFRTGDLGYLDEAGYLHLSGRTSTLIVTEGGENIQPDQVEEAYQTHAFIRECGVLQQDNRLVAVLVPALNAIQNQGAGDSEQALRTAVAHISETLPSYQRLTDYVMTREPLPRTRLGKIRRQQLAERYQQLKAGKAEAAAGRPLAIAAMTEADQALLEDPAARQVWEWLAEHYADRPLTPDTSPPLDLGIDSLEWLNLTLEIRNRSGVELDEETLSRIDTVRDLLREVTEADRTASQARPLEQPETALDENQQRWLQPLNPGQSALAWVLYALTTLFMRGLFRLRIQGLENLPSQEPFVLTPNHVSVLDPLAIAAVLGYRRLRRTYWGGWTGMAFSNPLNRWASRLAQVVPIDPQRAAFSSLAFGAAVLKRRHNLVWFPEGERSRDETLQPFKAGIGMLLQHFPVPVVPVLIQGTFAALPRGRYWPRWCRVTVIVGRSLDPTTLEQQGAGEQIQERIAQALHAQVAALGKPA